jgi:hypothetical protein
LADPGVHRLGGLLQTVPAPPARSARTKDELRVPWASGSATASTPPGAGFPTNPPERVVAYVDGRWRAALVISRGQRTALVAYVVDGPFGDRLRRLAFDRVRRFVDEDEDEDG